MAWREHSSSSFRPACLPLLCSDIGVLSEHASFWNAVSLSVCRVQAVSCLWPLSEAGFGVSMQAGQTFVVTGGHGSLAPFVVAVLKAWGGKVALATTKSDG